jgi:CHAT domain-containing protein/tetratricopeptide (TPR) repeat protein
VKLVAALSLAVLLQAVAHLSPRTPVESALTAGESHAYVIELVAEQYVAVTVQQQAIDVVVIVHGPTGAKIVEVDGPGGKYGPERIRLIAAETGNHRVEIRSLEKNAPAGRYRITTTEPRIAGDDDRRRIEAQRLYLEATHLRQAASGDGLRKAIALYAEAGRLWQSAGETMEESEVENDLGFVHRLLSDFTTAQAHFDRSLELSRRAKWSEGEAQTLTNAGVVAYLLGDHQRALEHYEAALQLRRADGNLQEEALLLGNIGEVFVNWGDHQKALDRFRDALPAQRRLGDTLREAITLSNIGLVYRGTGQYREAIQFFDDALRVVRANGNRRVEARVLIYRGSTFADLDELAPALASYEQALALQRKGGDRRGESETLNAIGVLRMRSGANQEALELYAKAADMQRATGSRRTEAATLTNMAVAHLNVGAIDAAQAALERSLTLRRDVQDRRGEAQSLHVLARVHRQRGRLAEALAAADAALEIVEALRTKLVSQDMRASYFATSLEMYDFVVATLMDLHAAGGDASHQARAFHVAERARARSLLDGLIEAQGGVRQGLSEDLLRRQRNLQDRINALAERQTQLLGGTHSREDAHRLAGDMSRLLTERQELDAEVRARNPRYAELMQPRPLDAPSVQQEVVDADTLLLEYALGPERSYLWALTPTSIESHVLPGRGEIEAAARKYYGLITARNEERPGETPAERRQRIVAADVESENAAAELSRMLLGPVSPRFGSKRLLIVADGALQYIPFAALPNPASATAERAPLVVTNEVVMSPSASALAVLRSDRVAARRAERTVAIIADPVFSPDDPRLRRRATVPAPAAVSGDMTRAASDVGISSFRRLPFSREEADAIASLTHARDRLQAIDFRASRTTALNTDLAQYRIVHFSTHGLLNNEHPELSGLVLSLFDERGQPQDGFLRLHDIYNLKLNADLVVLSACETALGRQIRGEGLIGLARGFMYAGASRVIASVWSVEDQATASLMKQLYERMLAKEESPAAALRAAQLAMWQGKRWRAPYYWAGFVLQGEWR